MLKVRRQPTKHVLACFLTSFGAGWLADLCLPGFTYMRCSVHYLFVIAPSQLGLVVRPSSKPGALLFVCAYEQERNTAGPPEHHYLPSLLLSTVGRLGKYLAVVIVRGQGSSFTAIPANPRHRQIPTDGETPLGDTATSRPPSRSLSVQHIRGASSTVYNQVGSLDQDPPSISPNFYWAQPTPHPTDRID